jgi:hypothetical protein
MSFTKKIVPSLAELKRLEEEVGVAALVKMYSKYDALLGEDEAIRYIRSKMAEKNQSNVLPIQGQV